MQINYVTLKSANCVLCGPKLHEFGYCPDDKSWYKRCLKCEEVSFVRKEDDHENDRAKVQANRHRR